MSVYRTVGSPDFVRNVKELLDSPIGEQAGMVGRRSPDSALPAQDAGALQIPAISDWEKFERFCRDLYALLWDNPELVRHGRTGQPQAGVDVYGEVGGRSGQHGGVQCKRRDAFADNVLSVDELRQIVEDAKRFTPPLRKFVVAYAGKRDVALQQEARRLSEDNSSHDLFSVMVVSWDDIKEFVGQYPDLLEQYGLIPAGTSTREARRIRDGIDEVLQRQTEQSERTKDNTRAIEALDHRFSSLVTRVSDPSGELFNEYGHEIDEVRDLLDSYRPKEALDRIESLEKRLRPDITPGQKFRIITNKAAALAKLGDEVKAGLLFIDAFQYNPSDEKALCNKALGYLMVGQREEAQACVDEVLQRNPMSERAHEVRLFASDPAESLEAIIEAIPKVLRKTSAIAYAIAIAARNRERPRDEIEWLEVALKRSERGKPTPDLKAALATALLKRFQEEDVFRTEGDLAPLSRAKIERVVRLLGDALEVLEHSESLKFRASWLANRAVAKMLLGDSAGATVDAERALRLKPDDAPLRRQVAFLLHQQGRTAEAINMLRGIIDSDDTPEAALLVAGTLFQQGDSDGAIDALMRASEASGKPAELRAEEGRLLAHIRASRGEYDAARQVVHELRTAKPEGVLDMVVSARIEKTAGDIASYSRLLDEARTYLDDSTPLRDIRELGDELYNAERYADACAVYERLVDPKNGGHLANKLVYAYFKAEMYEKALEAARSVPESAKDKFAYEIEVSILDAMGDLPRAIEAATSYLQAHPEDLAFRIRLATVLHRAERMEELDAFLRGPIDLTSLPEELRFACARQLALLYSGRDMPRKAIEVAYELRKKSPRNGEAHTTFMEVFFQREKSLSELLSPTAVSIDTAVRVVDEVGSKRWIVIEGEPAGDRDAIGPWDPLAERLMGKVVGEEIIEDEGQPQETRLRIEEIKSKYVHALHETMELLPQLYIGRGSAPVRRLAVRTTPEGETPTTSDLRGLFDTLNSREEQVARVQSLYEEGRVGIGTFAHLVGRDVIEVWGGIVARGSIGIRCCAGSAEERAEAFQTVKVNDRVAVDLTALLTCGSVDFLEALGSSFREIFVAQSTLDALAQAISEKNGIGSEGFMTVGRYDGQYFRHEVTAEDLKKQVAFLEKLKKWAKENCRIAPVTEVLKLAKQQREALYRSVGQSLTDTILIARAKGCPVYSDDYVTRVVALAEYGVKGVWTQAIVMTRQKEGVLDAEETERVSLALCSLNYKHTTIAGTTLMHAARTAGWSNSGSFQQGLQSIGGVNIERQSVMAVAVDFFYELWKEPMVADLQRESLVFATLDAIAQRGDRTEIAGRVEVLIPLRFRGAPIAGRHLLKLVAAWRAIRG